MIKPVEFLRTHKHAIIWTICYVAIMWAILSGMFNFDMFSHSDWMRLMRAQLRGFGGFVFGILILAALPLYIATMTVIIRTKKPLITISLPAFMTPTPADTPQAAAPPVVATPPTATENTPPAELPHGLPGELRAPFLLARERASALQSLSPATTTNKHATPLPPASTPQTPEQNAAQPGELPLPTDFDISTPDDEYNNVQYPDNPFDTMSGPVFKDIDFDVPSVTTSNDMPPSPSANAYPASDITRYMESKNIPMEFSDNGLIFATDMAIAIHDDTDFWIADADNWFATGKQKPSPIAALLRTADTGRRPVLYLGAQNIMNIDELRENWQADGICVITSPDQLPL